MAKTRKLRKSRRKTRRGGAAEAEAAEAYLRAEIKALNLAKEADAKIEISEGDIRNANDKYAKAIRNQNNMAVQGARQNKEAAQNEKKRSMALMNHLLKTSTGWSKNGRNSKKRENPYEKSISTDQVKKIIQWLQASQQASNALKDSLETLKFFKQQSNINHAMSSAINTREHRTHKQMVELLEVRSPIENEARTNLMMVRSTIRTATTQLYENLKRYSGYQSTKFKLFLVDLNIVFKVSLGYIREFANFITSSSKGEELYKVLNDALKRIDEATINLNNALKKIYSSNTFDEKLDTEIYNGATMVLDGLYGLLSLVPSSHILNPNQLPEPSEQNLDPKFLRTLGDLSLLDFKQ